MTVAAGFVALAAIGTVARVAIGMGLNRGDLPLGTFLVNVAGAFLLGFLAGSGASAGTLTVVGSGALGSFTTFSTFSQEATHLWRRGQPVRSVAYLAATVAAGVAAAWVGLAVAR